LRASIRGEGTLLRIELRLVGKDPRVALRDALPDDVDAYLQIIAAQPGVVSHVLARQVGADTAPFKRRVRQLKELGLTESLEVGYRLSPRGRAVLDRLLAVD
jgi:hypothetical protein